MKVSVSADTQATAGVVDREQVRAGAPDHRALADLLRGEVDAAIEGPPDRRAGRRRLRGPGGARDR